MSSPKYTVTYNGKDITADITADLISIEYRDQLEGQSDELTITVEDGELKWLGDWYPEKKDTLTLEYGYDGNLIEAGSFTIDEIAVAAPPAQVELRAMAAGINSPLRTKRSDSYEDQTLKQVAEAVAERHGLELIDGTAQTTRININFDVERANCINGAAAIRNAITINTLQGYAAAAVKWYPIAVSTGQLLATKGRQADSQYILSTVELWRASFTYRALPDIQRSQSIALAFATRLDAIAATLTNIDSTTTKSRLDVKVARITQDQVSDLSFLRDLAERYGLVFSVRGGSLIFTSLYEIDGLSPILTLTRQDLISYRGKDKASQVYGSARVRHHNPATSKVVEATVTADQLPGDLPTGATSDDVLEIHARAENEQQAEEQARAALYRANSKAQELDFEVAGTPLLLAGVSIILTDLKKFSGRWTVTQSTHSFSTSGYTTSARCKRVGSS